LNCDIVFIKNIDNVVPDSLKPVTILYKKILGGYLVKLQKDIFDYAALLAVGEVSEEKLAEIVEFCERELSVSFPACFSECSLAERCERVLSKLDRPLRVCGVVRNVGEPGGGPFWVEDENGFLSFRFSRKYRLTENPNSSVPCGSRQLILTRWISSVAFGITSLRNIT
jgi:hypothetical protein